MEKLSNENNQRAGKQRPLLLVLHVNKSLPINDVGGKVLMERIGDWKKYVVLELDETFDSLTPRDQWGPKLAELRNRYLKILSLGEKDRLEIKVL